MMLQGDAYREHTESDNRFSLRASCHPGRFQTMDSGATVLISQENHIISAKAFL
jgi:hypothetical protein